MQTNAHSPPDFRPASVRAARTACPPIDTHGTRQDLGTADGLTSVTQRAWRFSLPGSSFGARRGASALQ